MENYNKDSVNLGIHNLQQISFVLDGQKKMSDYIFIKIINSIHCN